MMGMNEQIQNIKKVRLFLIEQIGSLTNEQLNKIPTGYTNNIIWNLTHLISTQQTISYSRAGQQPIVPEKYIVPFSTNTIPDGIIDNKEIMQIKSLLTTSIDEFQTDYDDERFENYTMSPNIRKVYGIEIKNINDALSFLLYHEGYHTGYIMSLRKLVD